MPNKRKPSISSQQQFQQPPVLPGWLKRKRTPSFWGKIEKILRYDLGGFFFRK